MLFLQLRWDAIEHSLIAGLRVAVPLTSIVDSSSSFLEAPGSLVSACTGPKSDFKRSRVPYHTSAVVARDPHLLPSQEVSQP